jgi:hypothetical protein
MLTCLATPHCTVAFEPEGATMTLSSEDVVAVEIRGPEPA